MKGKKMKQNPWTTTALLGAIGVGLLATGSAIAQDQGGKRGFGPERPSFEQLDANGDGTLTVAEIQAEAQARFDAIDTNGDGVISADESTAAAVEKAGERAAKRFAQMLEWRDSDGDGALSPAELSDNRAEKMFSHADANGDGVVSADEFEEATARGPRDGRGPRGDHGENGKYGGRQGG